MAQFFTLTKNKLFYIQEYLRKNNKKYFKIETSETIDNIYLLISAGIITDSNDPQTNYYYGLYFDINNDKFQMIIYYKIAVEFGCLVAFYSLGNYYLSIGDIDQTMFYYKDRINAKDPQATYELGKFYKILYYKSSDVSTYRSDSGSGSGLLVLMLKYYRKAAQLNHIDAIYELSQYYQSNNNINRMLKCYRHGIQLLDPRAMLHMGKYYQLTGQFDKMLAHYKMSENLGYRSATHHLCQYYIFIGNTAQMIKHYTKNIKLGDNVSMCCLARYFMSVHKYREMVVYHNMAIRFGNIDSAYDLADYYEKRNNLYQTIKQYKIIREINTLEALIKLSHIYESIGNYEYMKSCMLMVLDLVINSNSNLDTNTNMIINHIFVNLIDYCQKHLDYELILILSNKCLCQTNQINQTLSATYQENKIDKKNQLETQLINNIRKFMLNNTHNKQSKQYVIFLSEIDNILYTRLVGHNI